VIIQALDRIDFGPLSSFMNLLAPAFVVVYDPDVQFIRLLEVYKANNPGIPLRVYFMMYEKSIEEQKYLSSLRREKNAFESLIKQKAKLAIREEQLGKDDELEIFEELMTTSSTSSRKAGGGVNPKNKQKPTILVDNREFRSHLPSQLHLMGFVIQPAQLEVGDYILSPTLCVERKSIPDLIGSFKSGRLLNQCKSMAKYYETFCLLIEFSEFEPFFLQPPNEITMDIMPYSLGSKLALLVLHNPKLRIIWSCSPAHTAKIFAELKKNIKQEPDLSTTRVLEASVDTTGVMDVLMKFPGINNRNCLTVANNVRDLHELCNMSKEQLIKLLGRENGSLFFNFVTKTDS